jgi:hypothetical protein
VKRNWLDIGEFNSQGLGEKDIGKFGLSVDLKGSEVVLWVEIVEVYFACTFMTFGRDIDYPTLSLIEQCYQVVSQIEMSIMVGAYCHF